MATARQAERWLALELIVVVVVRTVEGFRNQGGLLGAKNYAAMMVAFGMLAVLVMYEPAAELAAILGLILVFATLLRPTQGGKSIVGGDVAGALATFSASVQSGPPTIAKGAK